MGVTGTPVDDYFPARRDDRGGHQWYHTAATLLYVFFCFEIGVFLLLSPWMDVWAFNFFRNLGSGWEALWGSPFIRGAVSGLGIVNIWISFTELLGMRRSMQRRHGGADN